MDHKAIVRRLDMLQQLADRSRPCKVTITFADGNTTATDPTGAIEIFRDMGPFGAIASIEADRPEYAGLAGALSAVCHPVTNRRIEDFL